MNKNRTEKKYWTNIKNNGYSADFFLTAIISVVVVVCAVFYVRGWENEKLLKEFNVSAETYRQLIIGRIRDIIIELDATRRLLEGSETITRAEFSNFTSKAVNDSDEIISIFWAPRISEEQRQSFLTTGWPLGLNGRPLHEHVSSEGGQHDVPAGPRAVHFPILYAEPAYEFDTMIGFDMASATAVTGLLEQARDEGMIVPITGISLPHFMNNEAIKSNVVLVQPVYRTALQLTTIQQRRDSHLGYVFLQYDIGRALKEALSGIEAKAFDVYVVDAEADDGAEIIFHHRPQTAADDPIMAYDDLWKMPEPVHRSSFHIFARQWKIVITPLQEYFLENPRYESWVVLLFGSMLSSMVTYALFMSKRRTNIIRRVVQIRTQALEYSETSKRAVIENVAEGIVTISKNGNIETFNPAAEKMFGYVANEVIGENISMLVPTKDRANHDRYIEASRLYAPRIIEKPRDLFGQHKNGKLFPIELTVSSMELNGAKKFIGIMRDISERHESQESLRLAKETADRANAAKSEFLSSMSHELRTPLNAILGFGQMLEYNPKEPLTKTQKYCVDYILKGGQHLLDLINEVLDLAKIEAGKISISIENICVGTVLDECLSLIGTMANERGIEVNVEKGCFLSSAQIRADHTRFKQSLLNLLSNAVKYNRENGKITVDCQESADGMFRLSVTDTGEGIAEERLGELFEPFSRLSKENTGIEGTGIGLNITKQLIEAMDGRVGVDTCVGRGATFWIELPIVEKVHIGEGTDDGKRQDCESKLLPKVSGTILYIEDNPANLELMSLIIKRIEGLSMISAHNAELGIEMAKSNIPDLIILDINLPGMDGFSALKKLKGLKKTKNIPVIALSAQAESADIKKGMEAGFYKYLTKPMKVEEIANTIEGAIKTQVQEYAI